MLVNLFFCLKQYGVPVSIREHIDLLTALDANFAFADAEQFYYLARTSLVKDEKHFDKFDRAMAAFWKGIESVDGMIEALIPDEWLRQEFSKQLSEEEKATTNKSVNVRGSKINSKTCLCDSQKATATPTFDQQQQLQKRKQQRNKKPLTTTSVSNRITTCS